MAGVFRYHAKFYIWYYDADGKRRKKSTKARTKAEAQRMANELERKAERQRLGLDPLPDPDGGGTVRELLAWWLKEYVSQSPSGGNCASTVRCHLLDSELASMRLADVRPGHVETLLQGKSGSLAPRSINIVRSYLSVAFNLAIQAGRWSGANPVRGVRKRKEPKRSPDYLRPQEVAPVLAALSPDWRPLFATAIYTGLRKGELLALRKKDLDLPHGLLTVAHSHGRSTTKGGRAEVIPIAAELVPFLEQALSASNSDLLFPNPQGKRWSRSVRLCHKLRRALARAGIVNNYTQVCRRKGCGYAEETRDNAERRCPECDFKLWPKANVRPIRFHDLRHTTASLLMMSGANPAAVQRIMRHSDPRITTEIYGHLAPGYLKAEVDRLRFGVTGLADAPRHVTEPHPSAGMEKAPETRQSATKKPKGHLRLVKTGA